MSKYEFEVIDSYNLQVDGQRIELPKGLGGVMVLNVPSYAGGVNLWGDDELTQEVGVHTISNNYH
jgi:hypothetical protein